MAEDVREQKPIYALFDFHGHSCRKNVFIYGPKVSAQNKGFSKAKSFAYLLANSTEMFRFSSCIWKLSKCKNRTLRGVFLNNQMGPYAFTIEHSVSNFVTNQRKTVPFTATALREIGGKIGETLTTFALSGIRCYQTYLQDFLKLPKDQKADELSQDRHKVVTTKVSELLGNRIEVPLMSSLLVEAVEFEKVEMARDYSEGGSDSEFSDEDFAPQEKKLLLKNMKNYCREYSNVPIPKSTYLKSLKKDLNKCQKKQKKNEVEELNKIKEHKKLFEQLEAFVDEVQDFGIQNKTPLILKKQGPNNGSQKIMLPSKTVARSMSKYAQADNRDTLLDRRKDEASEVLEPSKKEIYRKIEFVSIDYRDMANEPVQPRMRPVNHYIDSRSKQPGDFQIRRKQVGPQPTTEPNSINQNQVRMRDSTKFNRLLPIDSNFIKEIKNSKARSPQKDQQEAPSEIHPRKIIKGREKRERVAMTIHTLELNIVKDWKKTRSEMANQRLEPNTPNVFASLVHRPKIFFEQK